MSISNYKKQINDPFVVGIDLGTTNSVISIMKNNKPVVLKSETNQSIIPSIVKMGNPEFVGVDAKPFLLKDPLNTIFASKRLMGRKFKDPEIQEYLKTLPYKTTSSCNGDVWIKTNFGKFSPSQIGAKILSKMKYMSEKILGNVVNRAVVTVPAYFNDSQRQATKEAGRIAGLDIIRVINEPTAAALAYGLDKKALGNIAVYDLGGGTFDISILEVEDGVFHVKSTNGDTFLGGEDFDNEFIKFILNLHEQNEGIRLDRSIINFEKIKKAAEVAKIELSTKMSTRIFIENAMPGQDIDINVSRQQFENVVKRIVQRTVEPCERAIKDANIEKKDIKHVILVGGMTRMPLVRQTVENIFGIAPLTDVNPDEVVAQGAAIQAGIIAGTVDNILLLDVIPLSLGIETLGGVFSKIIPRNTTLPFKQTETFSTSQDNQTEVDISIYQGERLLVNENKFLGSIKLANIPPSPRGVPKINVTFEIDSDGILKVSAFDNLTKTKQELIVTPSSGLTEEEVKRMVEDFERKKENDIAELAKIDLKNEIENFIYSLKKRSIELPNNITSLIENIMLKLKQNDFRVDDIKKLFESLKKNV